MDQKVFITSNSFEYFVRPAWCGVFSNSETINLLLIFGRFLRNSTDQVVGAQEGSAAREKVVKKFPRHLQIFPVESDVRKTTHLAAGIGQVAWEPRAWRQTVASENKARRKCEACHRKIITDFSVELV